MGLFGNKESKEEKDARKTAELLAKYRLSELSDSSDIESVRKIVTELAGTGLMEAGMLLGGVSEKDMLRMQIQYQRSMIEQNFIMIRQLDRLNKILSSK